MNKIVLFLLLTGALIACNLRPKEEKEDKTIGWKVELMEADRSFSALSESDGLRAAYLSFIDSNVALLRPQNVPITGGNAIDFITQSNDSAIVMTWEPKESSVAASGDMGYTFGIYSLKPKLADTVYYGTYVNIWKRQPDGKWKFVLNSANEGVE